MHEHEIACPGCRHISAAADDALHDHHLAFDAVTNMRIQRNIGCPTCRHAQEHVVAMEFACFFNGPTLANATDLVGQGWVTCTLALVRQLLCFTGVDG